MLYVDLSLKKIKQKLVELGLQRSTSKRFIRYEKVVSNHNVVGVEISKYHNIYELCCYTIDSVLSPFSYTERQLLNTGLNQTLFNLFSDNVIANE